MAGVSETRVLDAVLSSTLASYGKKLQDQIFDSYPFLSYLNGKLGNAMRNGKSIKRTVEGGESITEALLYGRNSTAASYAGAESLSTVLQDGITQARFSWKQYAVNIGITGLEERNNKGEGRLINLLEGKIKQSEMSLRDMLSVDAFGDGTGNGSKALTGLKAIVSTTSTLGGISPSTYTWWKGDVTTSAGSFAAVGLSKMRTTFNNMSFGNDKPDVILTDQPTFEYFEASLQPQERYTNTQAANTGFTNLTFKGIPVFFDRDCTAGYMYFLNSSYLNFVVHADADFSTSPFIDARPHQDVTSAVILLQGNLTTGNRRMQGVIQGFTA